MFNILGPLVNPMMPAFNLIGAYSPKVARLMADALAGMPIERAFVVHGEHGWDEATTAGEFLLYDVRRGKVREGRRDPSDYGLARCRAQDLLGGDAEDNARRLRDALRGRMDAYLDTLVLGGAIVEELTGRASSPSQGVDAARAAVEDGRAAELLDRLAAVGSELVHD